MFITTRQHTHTHTNTIPSILSHLPSMEMKMNTLLLYRATHRLKNPADFFFLFKQIPIFISTIINNKFTKYFDLTKHSHPWVHSNSVTTAAFIEKKQFLRIHIHKYVFCVHNSVQIAIKTDNEHNFSHQKMQQNLRQIPFEKRYYMPK